MYQLKILSQVVRTPSGDIRIKYGGIDGEGDKLGETLGLTDLLGDGLSLADSLGLAL